VPPQRIQLVEDVWDTIATEAEKKIIDKRLEAHHKNPDLGSPWENVYKRIRNRKASYQKVSV
jgi:putative addiction module component (TIGR02574 family)